MAALLERLNAVSSNFQVVINDLTKNKVIEDYEKEFSEVMEVLRDAETLQRKYIHCFKEMSVQLSLYEKKAIEAENKKQEIEEAIEELRKDLIKSCSCIENFEENEIKYKEKINELEAKLHSLEAEDTSVPEKEKAFEIEAEREKDLLNSRIQQLENDLKLKEAGEEEVKVKLLETLDAMRKLEDNMEALNLKLKQELERNQSVIKNRLYFDKDLRQKDCEIKELENNLLGLKKKMEEMDIEMNAYKLKIFSHQSKINSLQASYQTSQEHFKKHLQSFNRVTAEKEKLALLLDKKDDDLKSLNGKLISVINEKESYLQKLLLVQNQKQSSDTKYQFVKSELMKAEREMMKLQKIQSLHQSEVSSLIRDKEVLANNIMKMEELVEKYKKDFKVNENERITLYRDLKTLQQQVEKQNKIMSVLETIKTQLLSDIKDLTKKIENLNNELCCHEDKEAEMKTRITELTNKLSQQVDIANAAIFDRKMYCQHYKEARENSDLLKQKNDILDNYVNELKESFENQNHEVQHWENKWKQLDLQHKKIMTKLINKESECDALSAENQHLEEQVRVHIHSISLKEKEMESSLRKLNQVTQECMMLRSQLQIQNKKVQEYDEKLKQQESIIINEKEQYTNLENSAKLLHLEILRLTGEKNALICRVNDLEKLKQSFTYAKQELHKERFKNSALENAMHQPRNIHRWRMLKGTDPEKYKLIENYQTVQKQLLKKSIEGQKKDEKLSSMNKLVEQLKSMTTRNKHFESRYMHDINQKQILKEKNDKIKNLTFEVNMYESYMSSYQAEIVCLKEELKQYKVNQFFKKKKLYRNENIHFDLTRYWW